MTCLCWLSLCVRCPVLVGLLQQEKLSKDIEYLISKESQVKAHITQLDLLLKETEVRVPSRLSGLAFVQSQEGFKSVFSEMFQTLSFSVK